MSTQALLLFFFTQKICVHPVEKIRLTQQILLEAVETKHG